MKPNTNKMPMPTLRFPEFREGGAWLYMHGDDLFEPVTNKNHDSTLPILAITQEYGAIPRSAIDYNVFVSDKSVESYKVVEVGDFIISLRSFQGGIEYSNYHGLCSPAYIILQNKTAIVHEFFRYYFKTFVFIQNMNKNIEGIRDGKMVSYAQFSELLLPLPPKAEQQKIADCLTSLDDLIAAQNQKLNTLKAHKKGLIQGLFPANGEKVPVLRFGEFEGEWEEKELGEICELVNEKVNANKYILMSVTSGVGLVSQTEKFGKEIAGDQYKSYYVIRQWDFAYNKSSTKHYPEGYIAMLKNPEAAAVPNSIFTCFRIYNEKVSPPFLDYLFNDNFHGKWLRKFIEVGARINGLLSVETSILFNMPIIFPTLPEQQKIASCLTALDDMIGAQDGKIAALHLHKKGLLQQLFGRIG
jgi:type I restriction enzyme, S subunit